MNNYIKLGALGVLGLVMTGCADTTVDYFPVEKPQSVIDYEYLNEYGPLKSYIDRQAHPGFLLGTGVGAGDYINKGLIYRVTNNNFDQMTAGNEMKYASIVQDDGTMDFTTVENFVAAAEEAGMQIYGHTLLWHAQQNATWLKSCIADLVDDEEGTVAQKQYKILDAELERWIEGMMNATHGYVKAWDLMNEGLDDTGGDIPLKTTPEKPGAQDFYWQDYLGENYVRNAVKYARKYYAQQEGANPADLKLFINDYNLEAAYNNNDKAKSLVNWIKKWEADGETKIDGIGSQMHVSYSCNPTEQKRREDAVVNMLNILANSGKLVRITELDMGIDDAEGKAINTADVTLEQHKAMGEYYKFIISKYFEIIPIAQQYGICQWAQTDANAKSGWRAGCPIGLWTEYNAAAGTGFSRKPAYGSFCEALAGK
ncbi:MAG: endo-1,4-beta-xylanase [Muribaculaceae bacterium]|nr:endo-1,4-beta-xylanase [Muribaculaceae bacterium]